MFEDFRGGAEDDARDKKRRAISLGLSLVVAGGLAAAFAAVAATASVVLPKPREVNVEFAEAPPSPPEPEPPPSPPPPPPPTKKQGAPRPAATTHTDGPPKHIPDARPEEADGELVVAEDTGPIDGFTDGGGPAVEEPPSVPPASPDEELPRSRRLTVKKPFFRSGCTSPELPREVRKALGAATVRVDVELVVDEHGDVVDAKVRAGHPAIPDALLLACARDQRFEPAALPSGIAIPSPYVRRYLFRPHRL